MKKIIIAMLLLIPMMGAAQIIFPQKGETEIKVTPEMNPEWVANYYKAFDLTKDSVMFQGAIKMSMGRYINWVRADFNNVLRAIDVESVNKLEYRFEIDGHMCYPKYAWLIETVRMGH